MARDPFAQVHRSETPKWVYGAVAGVVFLMAISAGTVAVLVSKKRATAPVVTQQVTAPAATTPAPAAPGPAPAAATVAANEPKSDGDDKDDKPEKKRHHKSGSAKPAKAAEVKPTATAAAPAAKPKAKGNMSQKEVDALLGM